MINFFKQEKNKRYLLTFCWLLFFISLSFLYYSHLLNDFFFSDDFEWIWHGEKVQEDFTNVYKYRVSSFYSPIVNFFFFIGQSFFSLNNYIYHFVIVFLHGINAFLVYLLINKVFKNHIGSILGAIFFLVNVYHYEAIVWISAVMHVLMTSFVLLSCLFYVQYFKTKNNIYLIPAYILAIISFFTKENGVVVFAILPALYLYFQKTKIFYYSNWKNLLPFFITLVNILIYSYLWQRNSMWIVEGIYNINLDAYPTLINSIVTLIYLPFSDYLINNINYTHIAILSIIILSGLIFFSKRFYREYFLSLFIVAVSFLPAIFFYHGTWNTVSAGRYAYLPSVGGGLLVAFGYMLFSSFKFKKIAQSFFVFIILFYGYTNYGIILNKHVEYANIDKQMRGMFASLKELKDEIKQVNQVILIQSYPFVANNYYQYLYRLIDNDYKGTWDTEIDWDIGMEKYKDNSLLLIWSDKEKKFLIANDKDNPMTNPALDY